MFNQIKLRLPANQNVKPTMQIFDLLQLTRKEQEFKIACRCAIQKFEAWKRYPRENDYGVLNIWHGAVLKKQAEKSILQYRLTRNRRMAAFACYIDNLTHQKFKNYQTN